jgi:hypothetical protein
VARQFCQHSAASFQSATSVELRDASKSVALSVNSDQLEFILGQASP